MRKEEREKARLNTKSSNFKHLSHQIQQLLALNLRNKRRAIEIEIQEQSQKLQPEEARIKAQQQRLKLALTKNWVDSGYKSKLLTQSLLKLS